VGFPWKRSWLTVFLALSPSKPQPDRTTSAPSGLRGQRTARRAWRARPPLARAYKGRLIPATLPDRSQTWDEKGVILRADIWDNLVLKNAGPNAPTFSVIAFHDPNFNPPPVVATSLTLAAREVRLLYLDRWPVEQLPLATKQMIGAHRAFVFAEEACQRLPELALLAGAILSYAAAYCGYSYRLLGSRPATHCGSPASLLGPLRISYRFHVAT